MELHLSQDPDADALLSKSPFALLVGMVLDQQVPLEWAFASPLELQRRLGKPLEPRLIAEMDPEALAKAFSAKPALHRYPGSMAARVQEMATLVVDRYQGRPEDIWEGAESGAELARRVKELPGFGEQKAKIFVALLGKQLGVQPEGWETASAPYGDPGIFRSVADITSTDTLERVRAHKQAMKAAKKAPGSAEDSEQPGKAGRARTKAAGEGKKKAGSAAPAVESVKATEHRRAPASAGKR